MNPPQPMAIELWHLVLLLLAFFGACGATGKLLLSQFQRHVDANHKQLKERLQLIEQAHRDESNQWQRVERELLELKANMPMAYVLRDDYIRGQSIIEAKLDGLASKIENAQLRAVLKGENGHAY